MPYLTRPAARAAAVLAVAVLPFASKAVPAGAAAEQVSLRNGAAMVAGLWCGAGLLRDFTLDIAQQYEQVQARLVRKGRVREITGRVQGALLRTEHRNESMELLAQGNELRITGATGPLSLTKGQFFTRAVGGSCSH
jgi:hypothetical protein